MAGGRPTIYNRIALSVITSMFRNGDTLEEICKCLGINHQTYYNWIDKHKELVEAEAKAKDYFFRHGAEKSLASLVKGTSETKTTRVYRRRNKETGEMEVKAEEETVVKHPPDYRAIKFCLHNRFRNKWNKPIATKIDITKMPTEQLQELAKECLKELEGKEEEND